MAIQLIGDKAMNRVVSHQDGVKAAVYSQAVEIHGRAESRLSMHRDTGKARVTITRGDTDAFVNLEDRAALSIEFGHAVKGKYAGGEVKYVPGLYIITGAAGLV